MAANYAKPVNSDLYTDWSAYILANYKALLQGMDPAVIDGGGTPTGTPTGAIRWNSANVYWEKYNGSSWAALAATYAIAISGNAGTVTNGVYTSGSYANPAWVTSLAWSKISSTPTTLAGYAITDAVGKATFTTKGDIVAATGSAAIARVGAGTDGNVFVADASQAAGLVAARGFVRQMISCAVLVVSSTTIQINGRFIMLDGANVPMVWDTVVTGSISSVGAGALDTGTVAANTWYYGWVIGKPDGTLSTLYSLSATSPTMPSGYTFKCMATVFKTNGSSQVSAYIQRGNRVFLTPLAVLSNVTPGAEVAITMSDYAPPNALELFGTINSDIVTDGSGRVAMSATLYHFTGIPTYVGTKLFNYNLQGLANATTIIAWAQLEFSTWYNGTMYYAGTLTWGSTWHFNLLLNGYTLNLSTP